MICIIKFSFFRKNSSNKYLVSKCRTYKKCRISKYNNPISICILAKLGD